MNYLKYKDINIGRDQRVNLGEYKAKGEKRLVTRWPDGKIAQDTGWTRNLMTDRGLGNVGEGGLNGWVRNCHIGTSNATPQDTDTKLGAWLAVSPDDGLVGEVNGGSPDYECISTMLYRFTAGQGQGVVRELGISDSSSPSTYLLNIHTLVTPEINWDITQTLDVFWRMSLYPDLAEISSVAPISIDGEDYNWVSRPSLLNFGTTSFYGWGASVGVTQYTGNIGAGPLDSPSGSVISGTVQDTVVDQGSGYKDNDLSYDLNDLNSPPNSIQSSVFGMSTSRGSPDQARQVQWNRVSDNAPIQKDETKILTFHTRWGWGRYP
jgi:hypothetical protein